MIRFLVKRAGHLVCVLAGITLLSFLLANISSIDPAEAYARRVSKAADEQMIEQYRRELGFDQTVGQQYTAWLRRVIKLDFGNSYLTGRPAMAEILSLLPMTLLIAGIACIFVIILAVPLGLLAAQKAEQLTDRLIMGGSFLAVSVPGYLLGLLAVWWLGLRWKIMPVVGHGHPVSLIVGGFILAVPMIGTLARMLRTLLLENQNCDYVIYAKARGISKRQVMTRHLLRGAAPVCIVMYGQNVGYLIAGTVFVETIFSVPGLGQYILNAAVNRDFPVINAYILLMAFCFVICNLAAELLGMALNPQIRKGGGR